jgi:hypothetical protein
VFLAHSEQALERLRANVALQRSLGVRSRLVGPAELSEIVEELDPSSVVGASFCGEDGYFDRVRVHVLTAPVSTAIPSPSALNPYNEAAQSSRRPLRGVRHWGTQLAKAHSGRSGLGEWATRIRANRHRTGLEQPRADQQSILTT